MKALKQLRAPKAVAPVSEEVVMKDLVEAINEHLALRNTHLLKRLMGFTQAIPISAQDTGTICLKELA